MHSRGSCACVITCHNYGRYLRECLDSVLSQTQAFERVIVVDDASDDDTPAVCREYEDRGVLYLRTEFRDAARARNAGVDAVPRTRFVLWVDADNVLPPEYRERLQRAMDRAEIGVAYGHLHRFDDAGQDLGRVPCIRPYDPVRLRRQNLADTCSLVRRCAWEQAGRWQSNGHGLEDWGLWLRITGLGWGMRLVPEVELRYRVHGASMSARREGTWWPAVGIVRDSLLTCIVTLFSGKADCLERWFAALGEIDWRQDNLHLVAIDNSGRKGFGRALRTRLSKCGIRHTYVPDAGSAVPGMTAAELARSRRARTVHAYPMNAHIARLWALGRQYVPAGARLVWTWEDDITVAPDALRHLVHALVSLDAGAACGCARSRFENALLSWRLAADGEGSRLHVPPAPGRPVALSKTGFYCTLWWRDAFDALALRPGVADGLSEPYYDWAASYDLTAAGRGLWAVGDVLCGHWQEDGSCLVP